MKQPPGKDTPPDVPAGDPDPDPVTLTSDWLSEWQALGREIEAVEPVDPRPVSQIIVEDRR